MKNIMASIMVAGLALVPILGLSAEAPAPTAIERATKAAGIVDSLCQQVAKLLETAQKDSASANETLAAAKVALETAKKSEDAKLIAEAQAAFNIAREKARKALLDLEVLLARDARLKKIAAEVKQAVIDAGSTDPKIAEAAAKKSERLANQSIQIAENIVKVVPAFGGKLTIPLKIKPSPTPVGQPS